MKEKKRKTIGNRVDKVVGQMSKKVETTKDKIFTAKDGVSEIAHDISASVKKAVHDSSDVVSDLVHKKK